MDVLVCSPDEDAGSDLDKLIKACNKAKINVTTLGDNDELEANLSQKKYDLVLLGAEYYRQKQRAQEKWANLGRIASNIAHEIKTPLSVIVMTSQALREMFESASIDLQKGLKRCKVIESTGQRTSRVVDSINRLGRDNKKAKKIVFHAIDFIDPVISLFEERARYSRFDLRFFNYLPEKCEVWGNEIELYQVLTNLLDNSCQAVQHSDNSWIQVEASADNNHLTVKVIDSGRGLDPKIAGAIFKPYFSTQKSNNNIGLGLSLCKRILNEHRGGIRIDNDCSNTCFVITLSRRKPS